MNGNIRYALGIDDNTFLSTATLLVSFHPQPLYDTLFLQVFEADKGNQYGKNQQNGSADCQGQQCEMEGGESSGHHCSDYHTNSKGTDQP